jgi:hypothetical protein
MPEQEWRKKALAKDKVEPDLSLNVKEVGFMLRMIDEGVHQGKFLELALQLKIKLQGKMETLMKHKEVI